MVFPPTVRNAVGVTTAKELDERFRMAVGALPAAAAVRSPDEPVREGTGLSGRQALRLFDAQATSRQLDLAARWLSSFGEGFYTIGSSGHEGSAAVAAALRPTDPALLHYRSGGFYCTRAAQIWAAGEGESEALYRAARDVLRGIVASAHEPIAGGRHKVFGNAELHVIPTTSTIASHLPRALGVAFAIEQRRRRGRRPAAGPGRDATGSPWPADAIVICSFGDASINHASATAAFNAAGWSDHRGLRLPVLFVCEDNGLGISVPSPRGWVATALGSRPGIE